MIPLVLDFTQNDTYTLDLSNFAQRGFISMVQSCYVDNLDSTEPLTIMINGSQQRMMIDAGDQCYRPILVPNPARMSFSCPGGAAMVQISLMNFPIAWGDNARGPQGALWLQFGPYTTTDTPTEIPGTLIDLLAAGWTGIRLGVSLVNTDPSNTVDVGSETWNRMDRADKVNFTIGGTLAPGAAIFPGNQLIGAVGRYLHLTASSDTPGSPGVVEGGIYAV